MIVNSMTLLARECYQCYTRCMHKSKSGFTIVELLIVIVVIAILAAISIVAYNGIQQRAQNSKTTTALTAWVKALKLYKVDNGRWPAGYACLGSGYGRGLSGTETSGFHCRQDGAGGAYENATFNAALKDYAGSSFPTPAFVTSRSTDTIWRRGLSYLYGGGSGTDVYILAEYAGVQSSCPSVASEDADYRTVYNGNTECQYVIGKTTDT